MRAERLSIGCDNNAGCARDSLGDFGCVSGQFLDSAVCRLETLGAGLGFARAASRW
jgi:hypothetical protein